MMANSLFKIWDEIPPLSIPGTSYTLKGYSVAALRTSFYINELKIQLDAGLPVNFVPSHVFITHGHSDHIASIPFNLYAATEEHRIQVYVPQESIKHIIGFINSTYTLSTGHSHHASKNVDFIPVKPEQTITLNISKKPIQVEVIKCHHGIACVGYGFTETKKKLKEEYNSLSGKEIGTLHKSGIDVSRDIQSPFFLFLGDTSQVVLDDPKLIKYRVIMIECTFILPEHTPLADKDRHMAWPYLEPFITKHPEITFILYHFSQRYKREDVNDFFSKLELKNVIPWIS